MTRRKGFSLIELLTTLVIISIVSTLGLPRIRDAVYRAKAARLIEQIRTIQAAAITVTLTPADVTAPGGTVPPSLVRLLNADAMRTSDGLSISIRPATDGASRRMVNKITITGALTPGARRVLYLWHKMEKDDHWYGGRAAVVNLTRTPCTQTTATGCTLSGG